MTRSRPSFALAYIGSVARIETRDEKSWSAIGRAEHAKGGDAMGRHSVEIHALTRAFGGKGRCRDAAETSGRFAT